MRYSSTLPIPREIGIRKLSNLNHFDWMLATEAPWGQSLAGKTGRSFRELWYMYNLHLLYICV
jgi:hypothetical protein